MNIYDSSDAVQQQYDPRESLGVTGQRIERLTNSIRGGLGGPAINLDRPQATSEMERAVKDLDNAVQLVGSAVSQLRERLKPVLMHDQNEAGIGTQPPPQYQSELGQCMESRTLSLHETNCVLRNILERLAV